GAAPHPGAEPRHWLAGGGRARAADARLVRARDGTDRPGPRDPARNAPAPPSAAARRTAAADQRADAASARRTALRERSGARRTRPRSARRSVDDGEGHQAAREELAGGRGPGLMAECGWG